MVIDGTAHDDSHARAILLGIMRAARAEYMERYSQYGKNSSGGRYTYKQYQQVCNGQKALLGDALIYEECTKHRRTNREKTYMVSFGGIELFDDDYSSIKLDRLYPMVLQTFDTKITSTFGKVRVICNMTEHALIKMIRRNHCSSMRDIATLISIHIEPFIRAFIGQTISEDFVAISSESYMPCTLDEDGLVVVKTWISRSSWTTETEAKLWQACEILGDGNNIALVPTTLFSSTKYLDSHDVKKYIVC